MKKCPTCDSPDPKRHPAVQFEGEVQICNDPFHGARVSDEARERYNGYLNDFQKA